MKKVAAAIGIAAGVAAAASVAYVAYKVSKEIDATPSETGEYKDKAKQWFLSKRDAFKGMIDEKNEQIAEIVEKFKEEIINETSAERRRELMENAASQIGMLKEEIQKIVDLRSKELAQIAQKISKSELFGDLVSTVSNVKENVVNQFSHSSGNLQSNIEADITYYEE